MNIPRLVLAVVVAFIVIFGTDFLIHGLWLKPDYEATKQIWRPEAEMESYMMWMMLGQFTCALAFCVIWATGFPGCGTGCGAAFGLVMGVFLNVWVIVSYAILPMPGSLAVKWYLSGLGQAIVMGMAVALVYRPKPGVTA